MLGIWRGEALSSAPTARHARYANYKGRGGQIKLCSLSKRLHDLFTMTRLINVFDHHDTEEQAIAAFVPV
jgi:anti-anti-sigma regulatory factor